MDSKLTGLQKAEDEYYLTANYLLQLANKAYELFESSEIEQKRQLLKLILQNPTLEGRKVRYFVQKPFDTILDCADNKLWLALIEYVTTFFKEQLEILSYPLPVRPALTLNRL